jgi:hypothetical protein
VTIEQLGANVCTFVSFVQMDMNYLFFWIHKMYKKTLCLTETSCENLLQAFDLLQVAQYTSKSLFALTDLTWFLFISNFMSVLMMYLSNISHCHFPRIQLNSNFPFSADRYTRKQINRMIRDSFQNSIGSCSNKMQYLIVLHRFCP